MGKYSKKTVAQKTKSTNSTQLVKKQNKSLKKKSAAKKAKLRTKQVQKAQKEVREIMKKQRGEAGMEEATGDISMGGASAPTSSADAEAGAKLALLVSGARHDVADASQPAGRTSALQLAASRGHVNAVRLLVEAGADRTGALEAAQDLAKLGATFSQERKAIIAALGGTV